MAQLKNKPPDMKNIFSNIPDNLPDELFEDILKTDKFRIERIISDGHSSPTGYWYDQETNEWVILLKGSARLLFEGHDDVITLNTGDYVNIPAHTRHRVEWTAPNQKTVWLAIHY